MYSIKLYGLTDRLKHSGVVKFIAVFTFCVQYMTLYCTHSKSSLPFNDSFNDSLIVIIVIVEMMLNFVTDYQHVADTVS